MQLYSLQFVAFLVVLFVCYYLLGRMKCRFQWVSLLVGSLVFYLCSGWQNLFFIVFTSLSTWAIGLALEKIELKSKAARAEIKDRKEKKAVKKKFNHYKWLVLLGIMVVDFGVLGYIKYWNVLLSYVGMGDSFLASNLLLPLGISFYTFMSIGYVIDVYNSKYDPEHNYAKYLLFISFFPQLIQGPINRYDEMASQLFEVHHFNLHESRGALLLIGYGMLKKYAIADVLVTPISHMLDGINASTPGSVIVLGILLYMIQQYGDFSGGIDMVSGVSRLFGIKMAPNFKQPYFSVSLADFWRRWHMSLGAWMRDYVFYPLAVRPSLLKLNQWGIKHLGKNVGRTLSAALSNVIVFLLVGLWHGAEAHYVLWGLYNGIVIAASDMLRPFYTWLTEKTGVNVTSAKYRVFAIIRTFLMVCIGRYFDRLQDPASLFYGFKNTFLNFNLGELGQYLALHPSPNLSICIALALLGCVILFIVSFNRERDIDVTERILSANIVLRLALYTIVFAMVAFSFTIASTGGGFLYANF